MNILYIIILLLFSLILFTVGLYKKQFVLLIFAGVGFLILGVGLYSGIQILWNVVSYNNNVLNVTASEITVTNNVYSIGIGTVVGLFGLFLTILAIFKMLSTPVKDEFFDGGDEQ
jgi:hypothetical protein